MTMGIEVERGEREDTEAEAEVEVLIDEGAGMTMSQEGILIIDQGEVIGMSGSRGGTLGGDRGGVDHLNIKIGAEEGGIIEW